MNQEKVNEIMQKLSNFAASFYGELPMENAEVSLYNDDDGQSVTFTLNMTVRKNQES